jgi:predicted lipoprotein with Yx(FWY)xxD motif
MLRLTLPLLAMAVLATPVAAAAQPVEPAPDTAAYPPAVKVTRIADGFRYIDGKGMTLYMLDPREARARAGNVMAYCAGLCAERFQPLAATAETPPARLWKPQNGPRGWQWTYRGSPVFTYTLDQRKGDTTGDGFEDIFHPIDYIPPAPALTAPAVVTAAYLKGQWYLADASDRLLLTGCASPCTAAQPLVTGMAARAVGGWQPMTVGDQLQWAWRGKPVFVAATPLTLPTGNGLSALIAKAGQ